jgi:FK506-binding protein 1
MGVTIERSKTNKGDGKTYPKKGDKVGVHYVGTFAQGGAKFDSSRDRPSPFSFTLGVGQVIKGWDEAIPKLSLNEVAKLTITSDDAYGEKGFGQLIPPNATLVFEVELVSIN